ncbi:Guanylate kinase [Pseudoalteromonas holothuriae]|uniref:Guanylate kinase n=1 Tax=Pseudoalteromonas holothuriae TaxID=2963714 RepID=A0ABM9GJH9_9GAMM|nr:guanylate kinase [Pseudoalteromonas sp. CIP111951]CAH9059182.1 Guanylate kinase [Pseudoalteromonas sp. CIP111951]
MTTATHGNLFILSSPSGAGKSSLIKALLTKHQDIKMSVSHTTRGPRPGENNGEHYHFVSEADFNALILADDFFEWAKVFDNYYGTSKAAVASQLDAGLDVFLDIDWQGAQQVRKLVPDVKTIFILPPSQQELENRLNGRGQDSQEVIAKRMAQAKSESSHYNEFDYILVNDDFDTTLSQLEHIVIAARMELKAQQARHGALITDLLR